MRVEIRFLSFLVVANAMVVPAVALGGDSRDSRDPGVARQLFKDGYELVKAARCVDAIPLFQKSVDLDPQPKVFLNLARCEEQSARYGEALTHWARARDLAREQDLHAMMSEAESRLSALELKMPRVTLVLAPDAPKGSTVKHDGVLVPDAALGHSMPLDPGEHTIEVSAEGWETKSVPLHLDPSQQIEIVVAPIAPLRPVGADADADPPRVLLATPTARAPGTFDPQTTAANPIAKPLFYGGLGLAVSGVLVGAATGVMTLAHGDLRDQCTNGGCPQPVYNQVEGARTTGAIATIAFSAAAVGLVASGIGFLLRPSASRTRATIVPNPLGASTAVSF